MDLHRAFSNRHQKSNMGSYIPQPCGSEFFNPILHFGNQGAATCHSFSKDSGNNMPYKNFNYPNCFSNFKVSPEKIINKAMNFTKGLQKFENNLPTMSLTCIVGGFMDHKQPEWNPVRQTASFNNPLESVLNHLVNKSIEITRTMSCPDPFNISDFSTSKGSPEPSAQAKPVHSDNSTAGVKMSYADVAKMNLSNLKKNCTSPNKRVVDNSSSQKNNTTYCKKDCRVISPPHPSRNNISTTSSSKKDGTNNFIKINRDCTKPKFQNLGKSSNTRRPQNKRIHTSLKRELGTKKNNQQFDFDGSMWSKENSDMDNYEDCLMRSPSCPSFVVRVRSISSDSDCSSEQSECFKYPRVRSISECSINSVDSDDSFIVFDECTDDKLMDESCDEESSSDENDECLTVVDCCSGLPQADFLQCVNSKWDTWPPEDVSYPPTLSVTNPTRYPLSPCNALKKVRFACGQALAKVRKLCVWDYAHRAARIGPWEQAARDRARFSSRISSLASVINPVLDPAHRSKIYDLRFAAS